LESYRELAQSLGATDSKIIRTDDVIIDERVRARCISPRCPYYGTNLHCPPHAWALDYTRDILTHYKYGIFSMLKVPPEEHAGSDYNDPSKHRVPGAIKMYEIVSKVQSAAFYDGYHFAIGFGGGPACKRAFCPKIECSGLQGKGCRNSLKVNPSMHIVGMGVYTMATNAGWSIYPIGKSAEPDLIPHGMELGLVLIH
jgi:predicted metal-binding protein